VFGILDAIRQLPVVRAYRRRRFSRVFATETNTHLFDGDFRDFAAAIASAPTTRPAGYDHPAAAEMYRNRLDRLFPEDLPLVEVLRSLAPLGPIVDFGGHIGLSYYALREPLQPLLDTIDWTVVDVAAVASEGERLAAERGRPLRFRTSLDGLDADIVLASGVLQYVEEPLDQLLRRMRRLPRAVVLHKTPLTDRRPYVTLNAIGTAYCPYAVRGRHELFAAVQALGYRVVQEWRSPELSCIPFDRPDLAVRGYTGALFVRDES
jgi:putative methyltransferase (TIGR04325 family)